MGNKFDQYVKVIRFDNKGFFTKPYNSKVFHHATPFIDIEVTDLNIADQTIGDKKKIITPKSGDVKWSGCFVFLDEYNPSLFENNGPMRFRAKDKKHTLYLDKQQVIWVRNINYNNEPFFTKYNDICIHEGKEYNFPKYLDCSSLIKFYWVKMSIELALERKYLYRGFRPQNANFVR